MSRLYWHTPDQTAELNGSEKFWMRHLAYGPAREAWNLRDISPGLKRAEAILSLVPLAHRNYLHAMLGEAIEADRRNTHSIRLGTGETDYTPVRMFLQAIETALAVDGLYLDIAGVRLHTHNIGLNTALVVGSDPIRLAAKIHAWGELHCWVEGPDRAWLASVIDEGLDTGLYRRGLWHPPAPNAPDVWSDLGWDDVLTLLRSSDSDPVVLSYSVEESFPNKTIAAWSPDLPDDWRPEWAQDEQGQLEWNEMSAEDQSRYVDEACLDLFAALSSHQQWEQAMTGLRETRPWARLAPDTLATVMFATPVSVYDVWAPDRDERIARAAELPLPA